MNYITYYVSGTVLSAIRGLTRLYVATAYE